MGERSGDGKKGGGMCDREGNRGGGGGERRERRGEEGEVKNKEGGR